MRDIYEPVTPVQDYEPVMVFLCCGSYLKVANAECEGRICVNNYQRYSEDGQVTYCQHSHITVHMLFSTELKVRKCTTLKRSGNVQKHCNLKP